MSKPDKARISYLAIASLVAGMMFFVPVATGVIAVAAGILAIKNISKSEGMLLGKGLAYSGLLLGAVHGIFWLLVSYAGLTFTVDATESAVVIRNGEVNRVEEVGIHMKIPFLESVKYFPTQSLQELEGNTGPLLFSTRESHPTEYSLLWRICSPKHTFEQFGDFNIRRIEKSIEFSVKSELRMAAVYKSSPVDLISDFNLKRNMEKKLNEELASKGVCVVSLALINK